MGSRRTGVALWIAWLLAGSILAFMARGAGPLPGDLALTRWPSPSRGSGGGGLMHCLYSWRLSPGCSSAMPSSYLWRAHARPSVELVRVYEPSGGYGFPSTTALLAGVILGTVCYLVGRERSRGPLVAVVVCVSLLSVLASGVSRLDVGEH